MPSPVRATTLPDQVFDRLVAAILDGTYAAGDRLPSQRALAADFGVNMASLRAAVDRLAQLRLVEVRQGEPMRVADWRQSGGLELLAHAIGADRDLQRQVFEARALLLREAAAYAAERGTDAQREDLVRLAGQFAEAGTDEQRQLLDLAFMSVVIEAAGTLVFSFILNSIRAGYLSRSADFRGMVTAPDTLAPQYATVARHIAAGDARKAAAAMHRLAEAQLEGLTR